MKILRYVALADRPGLEHPDSRHIPATLQDPQDTSEPADACEIRSPRGHASHATTRQDNSDERFGVRTGVRPYFSPS